MRPRPGGRLSQFWEEWRDMGASQALLDTLRDGYTISLREEPVLSSPNMKWATVLKPEAMAVVRDKVSQLAMKGAVEVVPWTRAEQEPGMYSNLFCVPKRTSEGYRAIIDLSRFNDFVEKKSFRMSTIREVSCSVSRGSVGATIDLEDAFFHVPLHPESRKYTRFILDGIIWQFKCLPMGLTSSPRVFTELTRVLMRHLRRRGMVVIIYLDDILVLSRSKWQSRRDTGLVLSLLTRLGFLINYLKSATEPQQKFLYLGLWWDLHNWKVSLAQHRWLALRGRAGKIRRAKRSTCRAVAALIGMIQSATVAVPLARARIRTTLREMTRACGLDSWNRKFSLSKKARQELVFWEHLPEQSCMDISVPPAEQELDTDASDFLLGWYFNGELFSELTDSSLHINTKELLALRRALEEIGPKLRPGTLRWKVDNSAAQYAILNQGSNRSSKLCDLAVETLLLAESLHVVIEPVRYSSQVERDLSMLFNKISCRKTSWQMAPPAMFVLQIGR